MSLQPEVITADGLARPDEATLWQRIALAWEQQLALKSDRTAREYKRWLRHYLDMIGGHPGNATPGNIYAFAYGKGERTENPSPSTITVRLAALRSFYQVARIHQALPSNPVDDLRADIGPQKARSPRPKGLTEDQIAALLAVIPNTPAGARDRAAIITAILTGLRRSELFGLRARDLTEKAGIVYYTARTKGGEERTRELPRPAYIAIRHALEELRMPLESLEPDDPIFPISASTFATMLSRYGTRAGLEGVTPHTLRHSAAKLRERTGQSVVDIQNFLGHRSVATTSRYLARMAEDRDPGWYGVAAALGMDMQEVSNGE